PYGLRNRTNEIYFRFSCSFFVVIRCLSERYGCGEFKLMLNKSGIKQSMSRKGNCWDNAVAESFFKLFSMRDECGDDERIKTLKTECIYNHKLINGENAMQGVLGYIEEFYRAKRIHSAIGFRTQDKRKMLYKSKQKLAA